MPAWPGCSFPQKSSVNLIYDILDTPDHFWDQQHGEWVYSKCRKFLSIDQRVDVRQTDGQIDRERQRQRQRQRQKLTQT